MAPFLEFMMSGRSTGRIGEGFERRIRISFYFSISCMSTISGDISAASIGDLIGVDSVDEILSSVLSSSFFVSSIRENLRRLFSLGANSGSPPKERHQTTGSSFEILKVFRFALGARRGNKNGRNAGSHPNGTYWCRWLTGPESN